ncbi:MAG: ABC transporter ATP-binding protein [Myxococcaceae bacterium]|nr:ABC transporter ATP-binding protein [Myxococcaceae bacterium]
MADAVLELEGLTKRYPKLVALDGVSLRIEAGEIFALLGPNGAGKTTLIGAVCGLVKPTSGLIRLFGAAETGSTVAARYQLGLVPQEINFDPFFTVRECLRIQQGYYGRQPDEARIDEVLGALKLAEKADAPTRALSGGMKRRLLVAKALVHRPRLVFLDEPTAGVDVELRRDLWQYVRKLRAEGTTIVLTTHYLEEAEELADRVGVIDHGKLLLVEPKAALLSRLGERRLTVRLSSALAELPEGARLEGAVLEDGGTRVVYRERRGEKSSAEVLGALYAAKLPIAEVETASSSLEEVMMRVLREGGAAR